jgi:hypothetical protein
MSYKIGPLKIINRETGLYCQKVKQIDKETGDVSFHLDLRVCHDDIDDDDDENVKLTHCPLGGLYLNMNDVRRLTKYLEIRCQEEEEIRKKTANSPTKVVHIQPLEIIQDTGLYGQKCKEIDRVTGDVSFYLEIGVWDGWMDGDDDVDDGDENMKVISGNMKVLSGLYLPMNKVYILAKYLEKRSKVEDNNKEVEPKRIKRESKKKISIANWASFY